MVGLWFQSWWIYPTHMTASTRSFYSGSGWFILGINAKPRWDTWDLRLINVVVSSAGLLSCPWSVKTSFLCTFTNDSSLGSLNDVYQCTSPWVVWIHSPLHIRITLVRSRPRERVLEVFCRLHPRDAPLLVCGLVLMWQFSANSQYCLFPEPVKWCRKIQSLSASPEICKKAANQTKLSWECQWRPTYVNFGINPRTTQTYAAILVLGCTSPSRCRNLQTHLPLRYQLVRRWLLLGPITGECHS